MHKKTLESYEQILTDMVVGKGYALDAMMQAKIDAAAKCWQMVDHLHESLMDSSLLSVEMGSMKQKKTVVNPLLDYYDRMQRTLIAYFSVFGITEQVPILRADSRRNGYGEKLVNNKQNKLSSE